MLSHGDAVSAPSGLYARRPSQLFCPGGLVRMLARLRSPSLDRALIAGANPADSAQLAFHARRLASERMRAALADSLERLVAPDTGRRFAVLPHRDAMRVNATTLTALAARLRDPAPVYARGVAKLRRLVADGTGPVYADCSGERLSRELADVRGALLG